MARANYKYEVTEFAGRNCIIIEDLNQGGISVTNDIENVVDEICTKEKIFPRGYMIVYKDSESNWDGYDYNNQQFVSLTCANQWHAIRRYAKLQIKSNNFPNNKNSNEMKKTTMPEGLKKFGDPGEEEDDDDNDVGTEQNF